MVNAPKKNLSAPAAGTYGESTERFTWRSYQPNEGKSKLEAERVRGLGALRRFWSKKKIAAEKRQETHMLSNEETEQWFEDYVERETVVARKRVEDTETAIMQEQEDMSNVEKAGFTTRKPRTTFEEMLNAIGDSLGDLASSDDEEDPEEEEDDKDPEQGKLSEDDEPGCVMAMISKTVQHRMKRFWQKQMKLDDLQNRDGGKRPTTSAHELRRTDRPNWRFRQSLSPTWIKLQRHLPQQHLERI